MEMSEKWVGREGIEKKMRRWPRTTEEHAALPRHLPATVTQHWELPACCCCFPVCTWLRYAHAQLRAAEEAPPWAESRERALNLRVEFSCAAAVVRKWA